MIWNDQPIDGIIFDVDGTLWDSTDAAAASYNKVFAKYGLEKRVDGDILKQLFGKPMDVIFQQLFPGMEKEKTDALAEECIEMENEDLARDFAPYYPKVRETMENLSKKLPLFIVSNCQKGYIEIVMEGADLVPFIKDQLCFGVTGTSKGQTLLRLMRENNLKNPIYVGDTQGDADACEEAGIPMIFCRYGFGKVKEALTMIDRFEDLTGLFVD